MLYINKFDYISLLKGKVFNYRTFFVILIIKSKKMIIIVPK